LVFNILHLRGKIPANSYYIHWLYISFFSGLQTSKVQTTECDVCGQEAELKMIVRSDNNTLETENSILKIVPYLMLSNHRA
jgi:hypothetical protein